MYYEKYMHEMATSSGWASDREFAASPGCQENRWDQPPLEGGVVLSSRNGRLFTDGGNECRHVLVIGATGTGKSRLVIIPSLLHSISAQNRRSHIIMDVKGELEAATRALAAARNYRIHKINFRNPADGDFWNPFTKVNRLYRKEGKHPEKAWRTLEEIMSVIFVDGGSTHTDPFWRNNSANLFRGICSVLLEKGEKLSIPQILRMGDTIPPDKDDDENCLLFRIADSMPAYSLAGRNLAGFRNASNITRGNILASYSSYLAPIIARDDIMRMMEHDSSVDFQSIGTTPSILYISTPDDSTALGALQSILIIQMMQELNECASLHNGHLPVRTEFYLDELCNIHPAIPSLETALTISRSRGIRYVLAIQSYSQLYGVYGMAADTIAANCSTWIALNIAKDESFRSKLSQLCGCNALGNPLITPSELSLLRYEQAIVIRERCAPYFSQLEDVDKVMQRMRPIFSLSKANPGKRQRCCA
jgi:type IV secretion system protein VirD4